MFITELQRKELVPATSISLEPKPPLYWALASQGIINNATSGKNAFIQFREFFTQWFPDFISVLSITRPLGIVSWGKLPFWHMHFILFQYGKEGSLKRKEPVFLASFPLDVSCRKASRETRAGRCLSDWSSLWLAAHTSKCYMSHSEPSQPASSCFEVSRKLHGTAQVRSQHPTVHLRAQHHLTYKALMSFEPHYLVITST